ncbi:ArnT family glycosyltransferase [Nonlabens antarcticus]|uniref:ArnT family glycosyltransferase n=1 Tax=Nonlabens antarcticus TaxID=392714 RepID=UPI001891A283|nr:glycosyltransferase family 39 protein [Nonlabens antarcticus]
MILKNTTDRYYLLFLLVVFTILLLGLGSYGLAETSEARYAEISREMFVYGDYLNPELLGIFHFHKPPVVYYITSLGYQIFGINEFGARFFLQVAVVIQLMLVYRITDTLYKDKKLAFMAGLIYFSMPIVLISSRNLTTDAFVTTFIISSIYCWQVYATKNKTLFLYLFYGLVGIALLTKGPVALLFVAVYIICSKIVLKKGWKINVHHIIGFLLCIAIGASWYVMVMIENPKLWDYFVEKQLLSRVNSDSFNRSKPFWFYLPIVLGLLLPYWIALLPKLKSNFKSLLNKKPETKILFYSSIILIGLFSIFSTKLIMYILPIFWMPSIVIAVEIKKAKQKTRDLINIVYAILLGLLLLGIYLCWFLEIIHINISYKVLSIITGVSMVFFIIFQLIERENTFKPAILAGSFGAAIIIISTTVMAHNSSLTNSTRDMVHFIDGISKDQDKTILVYNYLLTSIPFYTDDIEITVDSGHDTTRREIQFENDETWEEHLWDIKKESTISRLSSLSRKRNTYLLIRNKSEKDPQIIPIENNFNSHKSYPKWTLYYNK